MRVFQEFNQSHGSLCPICKTNRNEPLILIPIPGTEEGNFAEAQQYHVTCVQFMLNFLSQTMFTEF